MLLVLLIFVVDLPVAVGHINDFAVVWENNVLPSRKTGSTLEKDNRKVDIDQMTPPEQERVLHFTRDLGRVFRRIYESSKANETQTTTNLKKESKKKNDQSVPDFKR